jgi:hypothetical protein
VVLTAVTAYEDYGLVGCNTFYFGETFDLEDGSDVFLRNLGLSSNYRVLLPRITYS